MYNNTHSAMPQINKAEPHVAFKTYEDVTISQSDFLPNINNLTLLNNLAKVHVELSLFFFV